MRRARDARREGRETADCIVNCAVARGRTTAHKRMLEMRQNCPRLFPRRDIDGPQVQLHELRLHAYAHRLAQIIEVERQPSKTERARKQHRVERLAAADASKQSCIVDHLQAGGRIGKARIGVAQAGNSEASNPAAKTYSPASGGFAKKSLREGTGDSNSPKSPTSI